MHGVDVPLWRWGINSRGGCERNENWHQSWMQVPWVFAIGLLWCTWQAATLSEATKYAIPGGEASASPKDVVHPNVVSARQLLAASTSFPYEPDLGPRGPTPLGCVIPGPITLNYTSGSGNDACFSITRDASDLNNVVCQGVSTLVNGNGAAAVTADILGMGLEVGKNCTGSVTAANVTFSNGSSITVTSAVKYNMSTASGVLNVSQLLAGVETNTKAWSASWLSGAKLCLALGGNCPTVSTLCLSGSCKSFVTVKCTAQKSNSNGYEWACGTQNTSVPVTVACVGAFSSWGACNKSCGNGTQSRMYNITTPAAYGGTPCPYAAGYTETQQCNTQPCPVNCTGSVSSWSTCSATCGGGTQTGAYTVTTAAAYNGTACPYADGTVLTRACNTQGCPVDCVGSFGSWSACSATCGGGTQTSTYSITTAAANGGVACPYAAGYVQSQACNTQACPVNCVGSFSSWSACSAACGGGTQTRSYTVTTAAADGGAACPEADGTTQTQACNTQSCASPGNTTTSPSPDPAASNSSTASPSPDPAGSNSTVSPSPDPASSSGHGASASPSPDPAASNSSGVSPSPDPSGSSSGTASPSPGPSGSSSGSSPPSPDPSANSSGAVSPSPGASGSSSGSTSPSPDPPGSSGSGASPSPAPAGSNSSTASPSPDPPGSNSSTLSPSPDPAGINGSTATPSPDPAGSNGSTATPSPDPAGSNGSTASLSLDPAGSNSSTASPSPDPAGSSGSGASPSPDSAGSSGGTGSPSPGPAGGSGGTLSPSQDPAGSGASPAPPPPAPLPSTSPGTASDSSSPVPLPSAPAPSPSPAPAGGNSASPAPPEPGPSSSPAPSSNGSTNNNAGVSPIPGSSAGSNQTNRASPVPALPNPALVEDTSGFTPAAFVIGGNLSFAGVTVTALGPTIMAANASSERTALLNGSLLFTTLQSLLVPVVGNFSLHRSMNWTYDATYKHFTTTLDVAGELIMTRIATNSSSSSSGSSISDVMKPSVDGTLTLFSKAYPGPGFSGHYNWSGSLLMAPDPFREWGLSAGAAASPSRRILLKRSSTHSSGGFATHAQGLTPVQPLGGLQGTSVASNTEATSKSSLAADYRLWQPVAAAAPPATAYVLPSYACGNSSGHSGHTPCSPGSHHCRQDMKHHSNSSDSVSSETPDVRYASTASAAGAASLSSHHNTVRASLDSTGPPTPLSPSRTSRTLLSSSLLPVSGRVVVQEAYKGSSSNSSTAGAHPVPVDDGSIVVSGQYQADTGVNSTCWGSVICPVNSSATDGRSSPQQGSPESSNTGQPSSSTVIAAGDSGEAYLMYCIQIAAAVVGTLLLVAIAVWVILVFVGKRRQEQEEKRVVQEQQQQVDSQDEQVVSDDIAGEPMLEHSPLLSLQSSQSGSRRSTGSQRQLEQSLGGNKDSSRCGLESQLQQEEQQRTLSVVAAGDEGPVPAGSRTLTRKTAALSPTHSLPGSARVTIDSWPLPQQDAEHDPLAERYLPYITGRQSPADMLEAAAVKAGNRQGHVPAIWSMTGSIGSLSPSGISPRLTAAGDAEEEPALNLPGSGIAASGTGWVCPRPADGCQGMTTAVAVGAPEAAEQETAAASSPIKWGLRAAPASAIAQEPSHQQTPSSKLLQRLFGKQQASDRLAEASAAYGTPRFGAGPQHRRRATGQYYSNSRSRSVDGQLTNIPGDDMTAAAAAGRQRGLKGRATTDNGYLSEPPAVTQPHSYLRQRVAAAARSPAAHSGSPTHQDYGTAGSNRSINATGPQQQQQQQQQYQSVADFQQPPEANADVFNKWAGANSQLRSKSLHGVWPVDDSEPLTQPQHQLRRSAWGAVEHL